METIKELYQINDKIEEGKLLIAAMSILTGMLYTSRTPNEVLRILNDLAEAIYSKENYIFSIPIS